MSSLEIRRVLPSEIEDVFVLLTRNGWGHRIGRPEQLRALIAASQIAEVAVLDGQIVGFARGISDGLSNGYLSMVVVAPEQRGRGIGRRLVEQVMQSQPSVTWVLRAGRDGAAEFFTSLGFEPSTLAMERRRSS